MANTSVNIPSLGDKFIDYRQPIWGDSFNWVHNRALSLIKYLVIHHTVTSHDATPDDIALLHKARGWLGIGYHFVITKDGRVWYVGDIGTSRANVADKNDFVIGIALTGDFTKHLPSDEQITSAHLLCTGLIERIAQLKNWDNVVGHKFFQATACPGSSWNGELGGMKDRIEKNIPYTPPPPLQEKYQVNFKGVTIAEYEENPIDQIQDLNDGLATVKDQNAELVKKNADVGHEVVELRGELQTANKSLGEARRERDEWKTQVGILEKEIEGHLGDKETLKQEILDLEVKLKEKDPFKDRGFWGLQVEAWKALGQFIKEKVKR